MLNAGTLTFKEFAMREQLPLATIHDAVLEFLRGRVIGAGKGYRLFQIQKARNRHLVDLRAAESLPHAERIEDVLVMSPPELIAHKVISYHSRHGQPKAGTDWRDLAMLLLTFPELKKEEGAVSEVLRLMKVGEQVMKAWSELVAQEIAEPEDEGEFD